MAVSFDQVRKLLESEEPNAKAVAQLGPEILPHLKAMITGSDTEFAVKAAYVASLINDDRAVELLKDAARSPSSLVRVSVASGIRNLPRPGAAGVILALLDDRDLGVRKMAIKAAAARDNPALLSKLQAIGRSDPSPVLRSLASRVGRNGNGKRIA